MDKNPSDFFAFILQNINQLESRVAIKTANKIEMNIVTISVNLNSKI
jgi:hypothetical protein